MIRFLCTASLVALSITLPTAQRPTTFRVLSWNVSGMPPVEQADNFRGHLRLAAPDILVLDEVEGSMSEQAFRRSLDDPRSSDNAQWQLLWGIRGGRQRIVIAAQSPLTAIAAFQKNEYPAADIEAVLAAAPAGERDAIRKELLNGIPVNAATVTVSGRRLLLVGVDLQCCGDDWHQVRRLAESRHIRQLVDEAVREVQPDGVILAGDFNLAAPPPGAAGIGALPLIVLSGPYARPIDGLIAAEAIQRDGREAWTITSGDNSTFPRMPFDFQLYSPSALRAVSALVMDSADYPAAELTSVGLTSSSSRHFSEHLPVVVTYEWSSSR